MSGAIALLSLICLHGRGRDNFLTTLFQSHFLFIFTETCSNSVTRNIRIVCIWYIPSDNEHYVQILFYFVLSIKLFCKRV
jgi:hypothetical protein